MIRKGKWLYFPCEDCQKNFPRKGRHQKLCNSCNKKRRTVGTTKNRGRKIGKKNNFGIILEAKQGCYYRKTT
jgi:hypothetical protein